MMSLLSIYISPEKEICVTLSLCSMGSELLNPSIVV
jgi:hypothetical protein